MVTDGRGGAAGNGGRLTGAGGGVAMVSAKQDNTSNIVMISVDDP